MREIPYKPLDFASMCAGLDTEVTRNVYLAKLLRYLASVVDGSTDLEASRKFLEQHADGKTASAFLTEAHQDTTAMFRLMRLCIALDAKETNRWEA